jgi:hypothetical protein
MRTTPRLTPCLPCAACSSKRTSIEMTQIGRGRQCRHLMDDDLGLGVLNRLADGCLSSPSNWTVVAPSPRRSPARSACLVLAKPGDPAPQAAHERFANGAGRAGHEYAAREALRFGIDSTPPSRDRLAELLQRCGLTLAEQRTLGPETDGKPAWGRFCGWDGADLAGHLIAARSASYGSDFGRKLDRAMQIRLAIRCGSVAQPGGDLVVQAGELLLADPQRELAIGD